MAKRNTVGYHKQYHEDLHQVGHTQIPTNKNIGFLKNPQALLYQYDNLIRKLGKKYSKNFSTYDEDEDLFAYIKEAFVELAIEYDPYSGVDFAGYIVKKLPLRIKYSYISKKFLQRSRTVLLTSGDYSVSNLLDLIQDHGEGQITTNKKNQISRIHRSSKIDFSFKERIHDICKHVPMDSLDRVIFVYLIDGFSKYSYINYLVHHFERMHKLPKTDTKVLRKHTQHLKKRLRNYYLQVSDSPIK